MIKRDRYYYCEGWGEDLFWLNLSNNPLGAIRLTESVRLSLAEEKVSNFFVYPHRGLVIDQIKTMAGAFGEGRVTVGWMRQGVIANFCGLDYPIINCPDIVVIQARWDIRELVRRVILKDERLEKLGRLKFTKKMKRLGFPDLFEETKREIELVNSEGLEKLLSTKVGIERLREINRVCDQWDASASREPRGIVIDDDLRPILHSRISRK